MGSYIYVNFKRSQIHLQWWNSGTTIPLGVGAGWEGSRGGSWSSGDVLYLDLGGVFISKNSSSLFLYVRLKYRNNWITKEKFIVFIVPWFHPRWPCQNSQRTLHHLWSGSYRRWFRISPVDEHKASVTDVKNETFGLPWWRSGWESACQCRGHGFEPWSGKIPHATEQLGPCATTTEPARVELVLLNKRGRDSERPAHSDEEWPPLATTWESPRTETKTQHSQK